MARAFFSFLITLSFTTLIVTAETTPEVAEAYPPEYTQQYMQDCQETSMQEGLAAVEAQKLCQCTLREFQQKYTLAEFKQLNTAAETDETASNQLIEVGQVCFEELLYE
ncbi:MAG TPA: hypothetical protein ACFCUY_15925 [Xenococcaceae cyanobacterium]